MCPPKGGTFRYTFSPSLNVPPKGVHMRPEGQTRACHLRWTTVWGTPEDACPSWQTCTISAQFHPSCVFISLCWILFYPLYVKISWVFKTIGANASYTLRKTFWFKEWIREFRLILSCGGLIVLEGQHVDVQTVIQQLRRDANDSVMDQHIMLCLPKKVFWLCCNCFHLCCFGLENEITFTLLWIIGSVR